MKLKLKSQWSGEKGRVEAVYKMSWARQISFCMCQCLIRMKEEVQRPLTYAETHDKTETKISTKYSGSLFKETIASRQSDGLLEGGL